MRVPVSCRRFGRRHSLLGSSCARWGVEPSSRSADRRLLTCRRPPDPNGVVVLRMLKLRPGRAPALPRGRWCAPDRRLSSGRHPPLFRGQSLRPRWNIPPAGVTFTRRQHRFTHVRPSPPRRLDAAQEPGASRPPAGLLLARGPRVEHGPLRLRPQASHPAVTRDARQGGDRPPRTGPGTTPSTSSAEPPPVPPTCTHAPSRRTQQ